MSSEGKAQIYVLRTTAGQERNVANLLQSRATVAHAPIFSIMVPEMLRGYIFIEALGPHFVDELASGVKHARQRVAGVVKVSELEKYIITKPVIEELNVEDVVDVIGGPLKGMRAKITKIDKLKNEVTLELLEATVPLPITVHADYVRLVERAKKG
ncbi:MAG: transcription elongation factor Spt5 [Candidatus Bathyarchaeia archaeon]